MFIQKNDKASHLIQTKKLMNFSVLLSLYIKESPDYLRSALSSVFEQTVKASEVVLVEDGPITEELSAVVDEFSKSHEEMKVVKLAVNGGLGNALREGLAHCSYDLVARMDTDDISKPERFEKQLGVFKEHPEYDVVSGNLDEFIDDTSNVVSTRRVPQYHKEIVKYGRRRNPVNHPVVMFRKKAVLAAGGYRDFPLFEDYYLWIRMMINGSLFYNIQEPLLFFRTTNDVFKRRGGFQYACNELVFQKEINRLGYTNKEVMLMNMFIRFGTRIVPNKWRSVFYKKCLRRKSK